ncbi:MAG: flagellar hook assembly protein FlgD [Desulfotalea sp.]
MTEAITNLTNTTAKSQDTTSKSTDGLGQDQFLNLLVAQLQHQDPLNPAEGTEFTAQLAQFSSLEQLTTLNKSTTAMLAATTNSDNLALLNTIGNDVLFYGDKFDYSEGEIDMGYVLAEDASSATINIKVNDQTVRSINCDELTAGIHKISWDGLDEHGNKAPAGAYSIEITAQGASEAIKATTLLQAEVTGVNLQSTTGANLTTTLGDIASYGDILGIYNK